VHSVVQADGTVLVDDLLLDPSGQWTWRRSRIDSTTGLVPEPEETSGTAWFTDETTLVILERGSLTEERLRAEYEINDRSDLLTLRPVVGGEWVLDRYR
jgi:hypothetical protein